MTAHAPRARSDSDVETWLAQALGPAERTVTGLRPGNSRRVWIVSSSDSDERLLVRAENGEDLTPVHSLAREAQVYAALDGMGVHAPRLRAVSADGSMMATDALPGRADLTGLDADTTDRILRDFLGRLGELHAAGLPPRDAAGALFGRPVPATTSDCILDELDIWEGVMRSASQAPDPLLEFGHRWLRESVPMVAKAPVLVHGDAGTGNFLHHDGAVTGLIDWELAHPGDPVEDLAWTVMRAGLDGIPGVRELARSAGGQPADAVAARIDYHLALVLWKVMVIRLHRVGDPTANIGRNVFYRLRHRRMFIDVMAVNLGQSCPDPEPPPPAATERSWLYDGAVDRLKQTVIPAVDDPAGRSSAAGIIRVLRYLRTWDQAGSWIEGDLGPAASAELAGSLAQGRIGCAEVFPRLAARELREFALCGDPVRGGPS
ncbi:phosphotransferase family protein [uncultured Jatrophihabitans sp.]|uniref:phosphotransferase family protein n=1 Tax=uncultured Jatrophihabitans sp. TaxID=1610747 RepID=UPI0035C977B0